MSRTTEQRPARFATITGVHRPYLNRLPASEAVRYSHAAIALVVSTLSAAAGWGLVGSWATATQPSGARVTASIGSALAAAIIVWSIDRELISGGGRIAVRGIVAAVNALLIGEIILLALFAPFVTQAVETQRSQRLTAEVAAADDQFTRLSASIDSQQNVEIPPPASLTLARSQATDAADAASDAERALANLGRLRTAEATGLVVQDDQGNQITTGRLGDQGVATASLDAEISRAEMALNRALEVLQRATDRLAQEESANADRLTSAADAATELEGDRSAAAGRRDQVVEQAERRSVTPAGFLDRVHAFHTRTWRDPVLAVAVIAVHLALLAAELSVVLWSIQDRRKPIRLYPQLVDHVESATTYRLDDLANQIVQSEVFSATPAPIKVPTATVTDGHLEAETSTRPMRGVSSAGEIRTRPPQPQHRSAEPAAIEGLPSFELFKGSRFQPTPPVNSSTDAPEQQSLLGDNGATDRDEPGPDDQEDQISEAESDEADRAPFVVPEGVDWREL